jgi:hypothetical protein
VAPPNTISTNQRTRQASSCISLDTHQLFELFITLLIIIMTG